jgi:hypothetical protein
VRLRILVLLETLAAGVAIGAVCGLLWWVVTPDQEWLVTPDGVSPVDPWSSSWFAADGWFVVLGALSGLLVTVLAWRRHRDHPVVLAISLAVSSVALAFTAQTVGGALGAVDPASLVSSAPDGGEVVAGALDVVATGVLLAPTVAALTLLVLLLAAAAPAQSTEPTASVASTDNGPDASWAPQQSA